MIIDSKYAKIFHSKALTRQKYDELYDFAVLIRNHKNEVSQYVNDNLLHFLEYNKFQFLKEMRSHFKDSVPSSFDSQLYTQVFTCYENKFDAIQKRLKFESVIFKEIEPYKRNSKKHNNGDFKRVVNYKKQTPLSICLTYLARYGNENTIEYINGIIGSCDEKKKSFYANILRCCKKFGFERLYNLALVKRNRILVTVLQESLLKQLDNGAFEPKKLKREKVKEVLLSFRRSLLDKGSECNNCNTITFDYV